MRVLVVTEGPSEAGSNSQESSGDPDAHGVKFPGAMETIIRRLSSLDLQLEFDRVQNDRLHTHRGKGKGYFKRAVRWLLHAERQGFDALILLIDRDKSPERVDEINQAQDSQKGLRRRALGVAILSFDAWMLADEKALSTVLGQTIQRQPNPETIADPKSVVRNMQDAACCNSRLPSLYADLAVAIDLDVLAARCPKGFGRFAERIRKL